MQESFLTRALFGAAAAMALGWLAGCEQFDPVKTESLCEGRTFVSMRCPQCLTQPYAVECSVCSTEPAKSDMEMCQRETTASPGTDPDSGAGGTGENRDGSTGESGAGAESGRGGAGEGGGGQSGGGSGGKSGPTSGAGGVVPNSSGCADDFECMIRDPQKPGCDPQSRQCFQCTRDEHCPMGMQVCNTQIHRCQTCVNDSDCAPHNCDEASMVCVDCEEDKDCTADPIDNNCNTRAHMCVDCVTDAGCSDESEKKTCDMGAFTCVDCLADGDCTVEGKPTCDAPRRVCVGCLSDANCTDRVNNACDTTKQVCVDCVDDNGCSGSTPRCDMPNQVCVACLDNSDCSSNHCFENQCVECEADGDCADPTQARCDLGSHECVPCTSNAQCGHLSATRACDTNAGRCVECNDDTTCAGKACIRAKHECSDVNVNSVSVCRECEADSQCMTNMKCVPLSFGSTLYGSYCLFTRSSRTGGSCSGSSARPYTQSFASRSVDNASSVQFCAPIETTTCPGVLDVALGASGKVCSDDPDCGIGLGDGHCAGGKCTYVCNGDSNNCPGSLMCLQGGSCG